MITDIDAFIAHLKRTGRMKLLPQVLRELKEVKLREKLTIARTETVETNPTLISGSRTLKDGVLTDTTGKRALLEIYQRITSA